MDLRALACALLVAGALGRTAASAEPAGPALFYMVETGPERAPGTPPYEPRPGPCEWRVVFPGAGRDAVRAQRYLTTPTCPGNDLLFDAKRRRTYFALQNRRFFVHVWGEPAPRPLPPQDIGGGIKDWYVARADGQLHVRKAYPNPAEKHGYSEGLIVEDLALAADLGGWRSARSSWAWDSTDERPQLPALDSRAESHPLAALLGESACAGASCDFARFQGSATLRRRLVRAVKAGRAEAHLPEDAGPARVAFVPFGGAALFYGVYFGDLRQGGAPVFWARRDGAGLQEITILPSWVAQVSVAVRGHLALVREQHHGHGPLLLGDDASRPWLSEPEGHGAVWLPFAGLCERGCTWAH